MPDTSYRRISLFPEVLSISQIKIPRAGSLLFFLLIG